jgi:tetratricopeptide (TPR) repeat protein
MILFNLQSRFWWPTLSIVILLSISPDGLAQKFSSVAPTIPGVVEPLELTGDPEPYQEPTEAEKRLAEVMPKTQDPNDLRSAKDSVDKLVQQYPQSADIRSLRITLWCEINSKDVPVKLDEIDEVMKLQESADTKFRFLPNPELLRIKAKIEYDAGNHRKALEDLEKAVQLDLDNPGQVFQSGGLKPDYKSDPCLFNLPDLNELVKEYPSDYRTFLDRGLYYASLVPLAKSSEYATLASSDYERAATINPRSAVPHYYLGKLYTSTLGVLFDTDSHSAQKKADALAEYTKALQINPRFFLAYEQRAEIYSARKLYGDAVRDYDKAIEMDPNSSVEYNDRGLAKSELNDVYGAISDFGDAIRTSDGPSLFLKLTYENRADAYVKSKQYEQAIQDLTEAIKLSLSEQIFLMNLPQVRKVYPEYRDVSDDLLCRKLHWMFSQNLKYDDFAKQLTEINLKKDFDDFILADLFVKRAGTYLMLGDYRSAIVDFRRATEGFAYGKKTAERWHLVSKGRSTELYIDSQTAADINSNNPKLWTKFVETAPSTRGEYSLYRYEFDCQQRTINTLSMIKYNSKETPISSSDYETGWQTITPDTFGEQLYTGMCH